MFENCRCTNSQQCKYCFQYLLKKCANISGSFFICNAVDFVHHRGLSKGVHLSYHLYFYQVHHIVSFGF